MEITSEKFSALESFQDPQADPGIVDEEVVYTELIEEGAGAVIHPEEVQELGTHIEEIETTNNKENQVN